MPETTTQFNEMERAIGRIEGKLDGILTRLDQINGRIGKNEKKIDNLESQVDNWKGRMAVIGAIAGAVISFIFNKLKGL